MTRTSDPIERAGTRMTQGMSDAIVVREMQPDEEPIVESHRRASLDEALRYRGGERYARGALDASAAHAVQVTFVAQFRSSIIGSLRAHQATAGEWLIDHVHVIEGAREAGAGDALMDALVARLRSHGARWLGALALPGDRETKNLYERQGMSARLIEVGRSLD